jgi:hypothetical protein
LVVSEEADVAVFVAVLATAAVNDLLGVLVGVFVLVRVGVPVGRTIAVPVIEAVAEGVAELIASSVSFAPGVSGVSVQICGRERGEGVRVGTLKDATGVGGGKGLINVYGLTKIFMKIVANARPASITIDAKMSQNDSFIASFLLKNNYCVNFSITWNKLESIRQELG